MRIILCIAATVALLAGTNRCRADEQTELRAIIDKAITAAGGEGKLAKFKAQTWKGKGTYYGMGDGQPYTANYAVQWPGRFRFEVEGAFTIVLAGDKGWVKTANGTVDLPAEQVAAQKEEHYAGWVATLLPLKDKAFQLSPIGELKVGDRNTVGVRVSRKDRPDVNLYFDKEKGLLAKIEHPVKSRELGGKEVTQEVFHSDYREIEGAKIAMKIVLKRDGKLFVEGENSDVKPAESLDDSVFAKP